MSDKSEWEKVAKKKTPEQWFNEIMALPVQDEEERSKVANIIWWDYFSDRKQSERFGQLDSIINFNGTRNIDIERLEILLMALGCPQSIAHRRANVSNTIIDKTVSRRNSGVEACFYAICEQAIIDVKTLVAAGVIVNGKVKEGWPIIGSWGVCGYMHKRDVENLLEWVTDGSLQESMKSLGVFIKDEVLMENIGLGSADHVA